MKPYRWQVGLFTISVLWSEFHFLVRRLVGFTFSRKKWQFSVALLWWPTKVRSIFQFQQIKHTLSLLRCTCMIKVSSSPIRDEHLVLVTSLDTEKLLD